MHRSGQVTRWLVPSRRFRFAGVVALAAFVSSPSLHAQNDDPSNEYRFSLYTYYPVFGDLTGFSEFGYAFNPDQKYDRYIAEWPNLNYKVNKWLQAIVGLRNQYQINHDGGDTLQLRPYIGPRLFVPNSWKWDIYNYTRYEYLDTLNEETKEWSAYSRIRSRFGVQFPIASRDNAWQPKTWYGLADVEPFYRFDPNSFNQLRLRAGGGYIVNDRIRIEFIYTAQFNRQSGGGFEFNQNTFQITARIGLARGIIRRVLNNDEKDK